MEMEINIIFNIADATAAFEDIDLICINDLTDANVLGID